MPPQPKNKSRQYPNSKHHKKTKSIRRKKQRVAAPEKANEDPGPNASLLAGLVDDPDTTFEDKLERLKALYAKWKHEDVEEVVEGLELIFWQKNRCKEVGLVVFGFALHQGQIDAIWTLYFERRDLLLLAKTGFGKSLIFQLLPFMAPTTGVVLVLMPLKLLQTEQSDMINMRLPKGNAIVLNGDNNQENIQQAIAIGNYTHVFTNPEIALSKKFNKNILDQNVFTDRLYLLAVDEIHLVEEWGKQFRPLYAEIEKVRKRIPAHIPLVGVSATMTPKIRAKVVSKAGFLPNYQLMQTSLDRPEIMQVHRFMKHSKSSCLDF